MSDEIAEKDLGDLNAMFGVDKSKEKEGIWIPVGPSAKFLLARAGGGNTRYLNATSEALRPHARRLQMKTMPANEIVAISTKVFLDTVLLDWKDVKVKGVVIEYSKEAAAKLMEEMPDLLQLLMNESTEISNFVATYVEDGAKNS